MKPLRLTLEGLQSYREKQSIDFRQMDGCGLFGIFGPTGSGKSTVLDAMTLALFGKVSRARNKTQGIINSACDTASVSLTFELSLQGERRIYLIERSYRRKKQLPDSAEVRISRMIQKDSEDASTGGRVLADKSGDVDSAVEKLLGLNFDDFTRAVVLPQNQFQEFLLMTKKDKSDMLERLFCLEEYGRELSRKIAAGRRRVEDDMRTMEGSLGMLQEATDDALSALKTAAAASAAALEDTAAKHAACQSDLAAGKTVYQLALRKQELLTKRAGLNAQAGAIAADRQRLVLACSAEPIWPIWQEKQELTAQTARLERELAEILEKAETIDDELTNGRQTAALAQQAGQLTAQLQDLKQAREKLQVDPAWRQDLEKWLLIQRQKLTDEKALLAAQANGLELAGRLRELAGLANQADAAAAAGISAVVLELAGQLRDDEPCPVCGARKHPSPANAKIPPNSLVSETDRKNLHRELAQVEEREAVNMRQIETLRKQLTDLLPPAAALLRRRPGLSDLTDPGAELEHLFAQEIELADLQKKIPGLETEAQRIQEQLSMRRQELESQRQELEHQKIEDRTRLSMIEKNLEKLTNQIAKMFQTAGFCDTAALTAARLEPEQRAFLEQKLAQYDEETNDIKIQLRACEDQLQGRWLETEAWQQIENAARAAAKALDEARIMADRSRQKLADMQASQELRRQIETEYSAAAATRDRIAQIDALVRGNAFVEYVAEERLRAIVAEATEYLQTMTSYRYALELDAERSFVIRDQMNGGEVRLAGSLSGGETFMASLALALALSSQIQIRGQSRLEFFFLDEGFGSLDSDLLDVVMDSLERISSPQRLIGLISHVPELRQRIGTHLLITPADGRGGSRITLQHG